MRPRPRPETARPRPERVRPRSRPRPQRARPRPVITRPRPRPRPQINESSKYKILVSIYTSTYFVNADVVQYFSVRTVLQCRHVARHLMGSPSSTPTVCKSLNAYFTTAGHFLQQPYWTEHLSLVSYTIDLYITLIHYCHHSCYCLRKQEAEIDA